MGHRSLICSGLLFASLALSGCQHCCKGCKSCKDGQCSGAPAAHTPPAQPIGTYPQPAQGAPAATPTGSNAPTSWNNTNRYPTQTTPVTATQPTSWQQQRQAVLTQPMGGGAGVNPTPQPSVVTGSPATRPNPASEATPATIPGREVIATSSNVERPTQPATYTTTPETANVPSVGSFGGDDPSVHSVPAVPTPTPGVSQPAPMRIETATAPEVGTSAAAVPRTSAESESRFHNVSGADEVIVTPQVDGPSIGGPTIDGGPVMATPKNDD